ncbi:MAG: 7-cyano-7-deazaguanine synthase [Methanobrevibacter sp.]|jgi:predicted PP-loop superfamily ATPase|nr:7-cyano-7-deazaguanine synthase [Candidatus Methanoflexus mossambicus]
MKLTKEILKSNINRIREEISHKKSEINIKNIIYDENTDEIWIITFDNPDKATIIGKGGWVVGRLREELKINKIHVISYSDYILKKYRMELSLNKLNSFIDSVKLNKNKNNKNNPKNTHDYSYNYNYSYNGLKNLKDLLKLKIDNIYNFNFNTFLNNNFNNNFLNNNSNNNSNIHDENINTNITNNAKITKNTKHEAIVALSGGVDSSFSLILAKYLGFNPIAITIDPGSIILPKQFKNNINNLTKELKVPHKYIEVDYTEIINESLKDGRYHPCGRCSSKTSETLFNYAIEHDINMIIFGDMIATGSQCLTKQYIDHENEKNKNNKENSNKKNNEKKNNENNNENNSENKEIYEIYRLNLPASLSVGKQEIKEVISNYNIEKIVGFGCPLLGEVHKKYPYMRKFSIQRILRETKSGALEVGEALDLIWSFNSSKFLK